MTLLTMLLREALPLVPLVFIVLFVTLTILNRVLRCQDPNHADLQLHQSVHGQQNVQGQQGRPAGVDTRSAGATRANAARLLAATLTNVITANTYARALLALGLSTLFGGAANSEFEPSTGNSMAYIGLANILTPSTTFRAAIACLTAQKAGIYRFGYPPQLSN